jgi:hypothetical protein
MFTKTLKKLNLFEAPVVSASFSQLSSGCFTTPHMVVRGGNLTVQLAEAWHRPGTERSPGNVRKMGELSRNPGTKWLIIPISLWFIDVYR